MSKGLYTFSCRRASDSRCTSRGSRLGPGPAVPARIPCPGLASVVAADRRVLRVSSVMSVRLLRPENRLTLENLLTPGEEREADVGVAGLDRPRRGRAEKSRLARATIRHLQRIQNRLVVFVDQHGHRAAPAWLCNSASNRCAKALPKSGGVVPMPRPLRRSTASSCAIRPLVSTLARAPRSCRSRSRGRTTGWRTDQSQRSWMYSPSNSGSLPSNTSFSVSRNRLLPNRRGRDRKVVLALVQQPLNVGPSCRRSSSSRSRISRKV